MNSTNNRRKFIRAATAAGIGLGLSQTAVAHLLEAAPRYPLAALKSVRVGIIGLDTSHCEAFTKMLNNPAAPEEFKGFQVVAAYPYGSRDIESSSSRIPKITEDIKKYGVKITGSIEELLSQVDVVLLETNDGRPHLEQATKVINAGKPLFIDKPVAGSLADTVTIFRTAAKKKVPVFSSSSLRFYSAVQAMSKGKAAQPITGADIYAPCTLEKTHPDLFWYGIHGIETLYTIMGTGCKQVVRVHQEDADVVVGTWNDGRIGVFRGLRNGKYDYGVTVYSKSDINQLKMEGGYEGLLKEIVQFFKTGKSPVADEETIEIYAFMEAADESKRRGGIPVDIKTVMDKLK
jgi:hypothetical protein